MTDIDWFAVNCAATGTPMPKLSADEKLMVVRRLHGRMSADDIGWRIGIGQRGAHHIIRHLDAATISECPVCDQQMWILTADRTVEAHDEGFFQECPLTGQKIDDFGDWSSRQAMLAQLLARRIRTGGAVPVWKEIRALSENQRLELLMVALAGIDCDSDPYAWMETQDQETAA